MKEEWLEGFRNDNTQKKYRSNLKNFEDFIDEDIDEYLNRTEDDQVWEDLKKFANFLMEEDYAPKTVHGRVNAVKLYFKENGVEIPDSEWNKFRRRSMVRNRARTRDKAGTRKEWRRIINHISNPVGKALYLTLLSTGMRIGETLQIKKDDLDLDSEPARINLRHEYAKNGGSGRTVFLTDEAKEHLKNYLEWRKGKKKGNGVPYDETDEVFPFSEENARGYLNRALEKTGLDERDEETNRRKIHIHSTRKFFRSNCGLEDALTHAIMGHREYLDRSYLRVDPDRAAEEFAANMDNLQVMENRATTEARLRETQIETLKAAIKAQGVSEEKINRALDDWAAAERVRGEMPDEEVMGILGSSPYQEIDLGEIDREEFEELKEDLLHLTSQAETKQKLVPQDQLGNYLENGWKYVDQNGSRVIVEKTSDAREPSRWVEENVKVALERNLELELEEGESVDYIDRSRNTAVEVVTDRAATGGRIGRSIERLENTDELWRKILAIYREKDGKEIELPDTEGIEVIITDAEGHVKPS